MGKYLVALFDKFIMVSSLNEQGKVKLTFGTSTPNILFGVLSTLGTLATMESGISCDGFMSDGSIAEFKTISLGMDYGRIARQFTQPALVSYVGQNLSRGDKRWRTKTRGW